MSGLADFARRHGGAALPPSPMAAAEAATGGLVGLVLLGLGACGHAAGALVPLGADPLAQPQEDQEDRDAYALVALEEASPGALVRLAGGALEDDDGSDASCCSRTKRRRREKARGRALTPADGGERSGMVRRTQAPMQQPLVPAEPESRIQALGPSPGYTAVQLLNDASNTQMLTKGRGDTKVGNYVRRAKAICGGAILHA